MQDIELLDGRILINFKFKDTIHPSMEAEQEAEQLLRKKNLLLQVLRRLDGEATSRSGDDDKKKSPKSKDMIFEKYNEYLKLAKSIYGNDDILSPLQTMDVTTFEISDLLLQLKLLIEFIQTDIDDVVSLRRHVIDEISELKKRVDALESEKRIPPTRK